MTEQDAQVQDIQFSPGSLLKQAREQKSLSIQEVSQQLKLTEQKVLQIEQDDYSDLPAAFYRGYLRNYAELVGLDENEIAENFSNYCKRNNVTASEQSFKTIRVDKPSQAGKYVVKAITALLILALLYSVYYFVVEKKVWQKFSSANGETEQQNVLPVESSENHLLETDSLEASSSETSSLELNSSETSSSQMNGSQNSLQILPISESSESSSKSVAEDQAATINDSTNEANAPVSELANTDASLSLHFSDDCWIRIEDANGKVLALGIKQAGTSLNLNGTAPYKLNLGKASAVNLTYQNQQVDLSGYTDSRPARLTLGE